MPKRSSMKKKKPTDLKKLAASIVADAISEGETVDNLEGKNPAAVALGRKGGLVGGKARAAKLTSAQRSAIARKAALTRWKKVKGSKKL